MDRASFPSKGGRRWRPGEVDLAALGVLVIEVDEYMHLDRDAAAAVRDDIEHRGEHGYTLLGVGDDGWMKKTGNYPLRDVFEFTAEWREPAIINIMESPDLRQAGLKLIEDARRRVTEAWL